MNGVKFFNDKHIGVMQDIGRGVRGGVINITPEQAEKMLDKNVKNRAIRKGKVEQYASDMLNGRWQMNCVPIIFSNNNYLVDGQHRLAAIIESGVSCESVVLIGASEESFKTVDTGAMRRGRDVLSIHGVDSAKSGYLSSLIQKIHSLNKNKIGTAWHKHIPTPNARDAGSANYSLTNQDVLNFYLDNKDEMDNVYLFCFRQKNQASKIINFVLYMLVFYVLKKININDAEDFCTSLATGEMLPGNHPIYLLREKLIEIKNTNKDKIPNWHYPALIFKAWNAYRRRQSLQRLYVGQNEQQPVLPI